MEALILRLSEYFPGVEILIDPSTLNYYGGTRDYNDGKEDSSISFRLADPSKTAEVVELLKTALKLNVDKEKYVVGRYTFENYQTDKRPYIWSRLYGGMRGLANPSQFSLSHNTFKNESYTKKP
jgi:hypothetical protein